MKEADRTELNFPEIEDSREICFEQGKPCVYEPDDEPGIIAAEDAELIREFDAAWERGLEQRAKYSFIKTYKPVMDDSPFRAWTTTKDYRRWCDRNVPRWLGYGNY